MIIRLVLEGAPVPKARARVANGHAFTPATTRRAERDWKLLALAQGVRPTTGWVFARARFFLPDLRRRDVDNCWKLVADALNGVAWADDTQIVRAHIEKHVDRQRPRTELEFELVPEWP